ncbi:MAG: hypothetical protein H6740_20785 [Alphaproteobacteria bacterium]|nr:hypothetical protein [Alphaproteobacteria bacterium]
MPALRTLLAASAPLAPLFAFALLLDQMAAFTVAPWMLSALLALGVVLGLPVALALRSDLALAPLAGFGLALALLPAAPTSPVKPFRALHQDIVVGGAADGALEALAARFPAGGQWARPRVERPSLGVLVFRLDPHDGRYDAEAIVLELDPEGRIVESRYSAD